MAFSWIHPATLSSADVFAITRKRYTCPWCRSASVSSKTKSGASRWIETPLRSCEPRIVCEACAIEVYVACISSNVEHHALEQIPALANEEGRSLRDFRRVCLEHQISIVRQKGVRRETESIYLLLQERLAELV